MGESLSTLVKYTVVVFGSLFVLGQVLIHSDVVGIDFSNDSNDSVFQFNKSRQHFLDLDTYYESGKENADVFHERKGNSDGGVGDDDATATRGDVSNDNNNDERDKTIESSASNNSNINTNTNTNSAKPLFVFHVGPRKTATTTIKFNILKDPQYQRLLKEDNFIYHEFHWWRGVNLVRKYLDKLPDRSNKIIWGYFFRMFNDAYHNNQNVIVSNEAFSLVRANNDVKEVFSSLLERFDVRVILAYRPLESWYSSIYDELRTGSMYDKENDRYRTWPSKEYNGGTLDISSSSFEPITEWFSQTWNKEYMGDPLQTLETYKYIYGEDKVKILTVFNSGGPDITQQFICDGIPEAKKACEYARTQQPPKEMNTSKEKKAMTDPLMLYESDLLAIGAHKRGWLDTITDECRTSSRVERYDHVLAVEEYTKERGIVTADLPKVCVSEEQMGELQKRSWLAEVSMAANPRSKKDFESTMDKIKKSGKYCGIDVPTILSDAEWKKFFVNDLRLCKIE